MARDQTRGNLDLLLLRILSRGPAHGYAVISALKDTSAGLFDLPEGTVYPSLHRLEAAGLLASDWDSPGGRRRRIYRLTGQGEASLSTGRLEWKRFAGGMNSVLGESA
jgi:PadR family transcriptional regulator, regulatory protein PadR